MDRKVFLKDMNRKVFLLGVVALVAAMGGQAQTHWSEFTPYDTSRTWVCDSNLVWPQVISPCPEVQIKQKHDHTAQERYRERGWDTAVTCQQREILLSCTPYIPVQYFNGRYTVDEIPYDPADTTFHYEHNLPNGSDDQFCDIQNLPTANASNGYHAFPFYFFGVKKTAFVAGGNGIISFNTNAASQSCAYGIYDALPWPNDNFGTNMASSNASRHRDAIYGIFQDTDPKCINSDPPTYYGIWYGIKDEFPCRKIIASYNNLPWYDCNSNLNQTRQKYQIVCYEGSNIIEVHVAKRTENSYASWNHNGVLGIQNATGQRQRTGAQGSSTQFVIDSSYAAYYPEAFKNAPAGNVGTQTITNRAWRFTPQGKTHGDYGWYRLVEQGDTIINDTLPQYDDGYNSFSEPMQQDDPIYDEDNNPAPCPTLTTAYIRNIDTTTRIVFYLRFQNADETWYNLADTITIGYDADKTIDLHGADQPAESRTYTVCSSSDKMMYLDIPSVNDTLGTSWRAYRVSMGDTIDLAIDDVLERDPFEVVDSLDIKRMPIRFKNSMADTTENKIDSVFLQVTMDFVNGCDSFATCQMNIYPEFDITDTVHSCIGKTYYWDANGRTYYDHEGGFYTVDTVSAPRCDSIVHLDLHFDSVRTIPVVRDKCAEYTWTEEDHGNGQTYTMTNTSTREQDTVHALNEWGCEDIYQLHLTIYPTISKIHTDIDHFDYDHLEVELQDVSEGSGARKWILPNHSEKSDVRIYYTIPLEMDTATISLVSFSPYGDCTDTATVVLPFNKETMYLPNAFTPDNTMGNNLFGSVSRNTLKEEMYIYNRRGELVYRCEEIDCTWDGRDLNGKPCEQGAYVYLIKYIDKFEPDRTHVLRGTVMLIR